MNIKENMTKLVICFFVNDHLREAYEVMKDFKIRHLPVIDDGRLVGIISDRDLLLHSHEYKGDKYQEELKIKDIMTTDIITIDEGCSIRTAVELMVSNKIDCLPVINPDHSIKGIITSTDILELMLNDRFENTKEPIPFNYQLKNYPELRAV